MAGATFSDKSQSAIYRKGARADIESIVRFQLAMAEETEKIRLDDQTCLAGVCAVFDEPSRGQYYVGTVNGNVVCSTLITYEWSDWRNGIVWWIQSVYVVPEWRRQGIYTGLYRYIQTLAGDNERVRGIRLYVDRSNSIAQSVYRCLGMDGRHYKVFEWMK